MLQALVVSRYFSRWNPNDNYFMGEKKTHNERVWSRFFEIPLLSLFRKEGLKRKPTRWRSRRKKYGRRNRCWIWGRTFKAWSCRQKPGFASEPFGGLTAPHFGEDPRMEATQRRRTLGSKIRDKSIKKCINEWNALLKAADDRELFVLDKRYWFPSKGK